MKEKLSKVLTIFVRLWTALWREGPRHLLKALSRVLLTIESWLLDGKRAAYGIAVTRILIGCTALGLLLTNFGTRHYTYGAAAAWSGHLEKQYGIFNDVWLFQLFQKIAGNEVLVTVYFLVLMALSLALIVGYRARVVLPILLVLWINLIEAPYFGGDQGDNALRIAMILMLFTDHSGKLSFDAVRRKNAVASEKSVFRKLLNGNRVLPVELTSLLHNLAIVALAGQVFMIYVAGALFKAGGATWKDGSAIYGPLSTMRFSPWPEINDLIIVSAGVVALGSIGSIIIQIVFPGALLHRWTRIPILFALVSFHVAIALLMGIPWFSLSMIAIDAIFVRDVTWLRLLGWIKHSAQPPNEAKNNSSTEDAEVTRQPEKALV